MIRRTPGSGGEVGRCGVKDGKGLRFGRYGCVLWVS